MENPFLSQEFLVPWTKLTAPHLESAVDVVLARAERAIEAIAALDPNTVTFDSTFLALERATEELNVTWGRIAHLQSVADTPEFRAAYARALPRVSTFQARIHLHAGLWSRLRAFLQSPAAAAVQGVRRRFMEETAMDFREAGADLPGEARGRLEELQAELAQLTQKFAENVLDATNAWQVVIPPEDESRLAGLPLHARAMARRSAEAKGLAGWRFTLQQPSLEPVLTYGEDRELRRELWSASAAIGARAPFDNTPVLRRILELRREKARLLGQPNFAESLLQRRMAGSARRALEFVTDFQQRCVGKFRAECRELEEFAARESGGAPVALAPWDVAFWAERLRRARFAFDEEALRPYFPLERVLAGLFELAGKVFGLRIGERAVAEAEVWHPEVRFYDVHDDAGRHLGSFYTDWHPRESKRSGAWMNYVLTGGPRADGGRAPHLGLMCGNLTPPAGGAPALLTHREVETIFHEFGHLIHHLLGEVEIKSLNGVNVAWDFVELPSQIMENWTWEREGLDLFARHFESGAPIPEELFRRMNAARNFRAASAAMRQVAFAKLDLLLHIGTDEFLAAEDVEPRLRAEISDCLFPSDPPAPTIVKRFTHLFAEPVGYAAGYYSYKWAEVLEADAFTRFQREGLFSRAVGAEFVEKILSRGNSAPPAALFRDFMGRDPDPTALLVRTGLSG
jgi:oligopeptidase A